MNYNTSIFDYLIHTLIFLLIGYVVYRGINISFSYDECLSHEIITRDDTQLVYTANNHLLNSILMYCSYMIWGNSEFALRLPNILAFLCYLFFGIKTLKLYDSPSIVFLCGFCLLFLNPFLLDFFSLARGYGLSVGLFMVGFYYLIKATTMEEDNIDKNSFLSILFAALASLANLVLINFLIAAIIILAVYRFIVRKNTKLSIWIFLGGLMAMVTIVGDTWWLLFLKKNNELYHGSETLYQALESVVVSSSYFADYTKLTITGVCTVCIVLLVISLVPIFSIKKNKENFWNPFFISTVLFLLMTIGIVAEHLLFGAKYPVDRTTLLYIVSGSIAIYGLLNYSYKNYPRIGLFCSRIICTTVTVLTCYNFSINMNLSYTKTWQFDYPTKDIMHMIYQITINNKHQHYTISNTNFLTPAILYYKEYYGINLGYPQVENSANNTIFIYSWSNDGYKENYTPILTFQTNMHTLYIRNDFLQQYLQHRVIKH